MSRSNRRLLLVVVISGSALGFVLYTHLRAFKPFLPGIRAVVGSIPEQELDLAEPQRRALLTLVAAKDKDAQSTIDWQVARALLNTVPHPRTGLKWQLDWLLWGLEIRGHFSREQRLGLYCHLMQFSGGQGLSYGSQALFNEQPNQLTDLEVAEIVAIQFWGWRYYERHPERLVPDAKQLLQAKMQLQTK